MIREKVPVIRKITWMLFVYSYVLTAILFMIYGSSDPDYFDGRYVTCGLIMIMVAILWICLLFSCWSYKEKRFLGQDMEETNQSIWSQPPFLIVIGMVNAILWPLAIGL